MSGPYCKTCIYYASYPLQSDDEMEMGECGDPAKIISHGICGPVNERPGVIADSYTCRNHTPIEDKP